MESEDFFYIQAVSSVEYVLLISAVILDVRGFDFCSGSSMFNLFDL